MAANLELFQIIHNGLIRPLFGRTFTQKNVMTMLCFEIHQIRFPMKFFELLKKKKDSHNTIQFEDHVIH